MLIKLPEGNLFIEFQHMHKPAKVDEKGKVLRKAMKLTECRILTVSGSVKKPFAKAVAICSPKDRFDAEKGRKLSLSRALAVGCIDKAERILIWDAYFTRGKTTDPRPKKGPINSV